MCKLVRVLFVCALITMLVDLRIARADQTFTYTVPIPSAQTDQDPYTVSVPKFVPTDHANCPELTQVQVQLETHVEGTGVGENLDAKYPHNLTGHLEVIAALGASDWTRESPTADFVVVAAGGISAAIKAEKYDGSADFSGTDTVNFGTMSGDATEISAITAPPTTNLTPFIGVSGETYDFKFHSEGQSYASGSGNVQSRFTAYSSGNVIVTYTCSSTAVRVVSFTGTPQVNRVMLNWQTASEVDTQGYNLYRADSESGPWTKLNAEMIASQEPGGQQGNEYSEADTAVEEEHTYYYRLEAVDPQGGLADIGTTVVTLTAPVRTWLPMLVLP